VPLFTLKRERGRGREREGERERGRGRTRGEREEPHTANEQTRSKHLGTKFYPEFCIKRKVYCKKVVTKSHNAG